MRTNALSSSEVPWPGHFRQVTGLRHEPPELARRPVAEHRARTSSQDRAHPAAFDIAGSVAHEVDTAVDRVQSAAESVLNRPRTNSGSKQLPSGNHAMLSSRQLRQNAIHRTRVAFAPNSGVNATLACWGSQGLGGHRTEPGGAGRGARVAR